MIVYHVFSGFPYDREDPNDPYKQFPAEDLIRAIYDMLAAGHHGMAHDSALDFELDLKAKTIQVSIRQRVRFYYLLGRIELEKPRPAMKRAHDTFKTCLEIIEADPILQTDTLALLHIRARLCTAASRSFLFSLEYDYANDLLALLDNLVAQATSLQAISADDISILRCSALLWRAEGALAQKMLSSAYQDIQAALEMILDWKSRLPVAQDTRIPEDIVTIGFSPSEIALILNSSSSSAQTWASLSYETTLLFAQAIVWMQRLSPVSLPPVTNTNIWAYSGALVDNLAQRLIQVLSGQLAHRQDVATYLMQSYLLVTEITLLLSDLASDASLTTWLQTAESNLQRAVRLYVNSPRPADMIVAWQIELATYEVSYLQKRLAGTLTNQDWQTIAGNVNALLGQISAKSQEASRTLNWDEIRSLRHLQGLFHFFLGLLHEHKGLIDDACAQYWEAIIAFKDPPFFVNPLWEAIVEEARRRLGCPEPV